MKLSIVVSVFSSLALTCALVPFQSQALSVNQTSPLNVEQGIKSSKITAHKQRALVNNKYILEFQSQPLIEVKRKATGEKRQVFSTSALLANKPSVMKQNGAMAVVYKEALEQRKQRDSSRIALRKLDRKAEVLSEYDYLFNGLAVHSSLPAAELLLLPNVKAVYPVEAYNAKLENALPIIEAQAAWEKVGGQAEAGKGIRIAVIDSGINPNNPMFNDDGMAAPASKPSDDYCATEPSFCNNKLIAARFYPQDSLEEGEFESPQALSGHGSHVAGIAAGREVTTDLGNNIVGVAPGAYLMVYKALWGQDGSGESAGLLAALNDAAKDGADVINNSWGSDSGASPAASLYKSVFEELESEGIVVVTAAGNEGELGAKSISCPGCVESGITVASTTTDFISGYILSFGVNEVVSLPGEGFVDGTTFSATGVLASDAGELGCEAWASGAVTDKVAVVKRGTCLFSEKAGFAQEAGAVALVVINNEPGPLVRMQLDSTITIPTTFISDSDGERLLSFLNATGASEISMTGVQETSQDPELADVVSGFSSLGPNGDDGFIKPDLSAPGDLILSATSPDDSASPDLNYVYLGGTSMATPMVAGAAALLKQQQPELSAKQIKNILINSVDAGITDPTDTRLATAFETGSGRLNIKQAMELSAYGETPNLANNKCFILCTISNSLVSKSNIAQSWSGEVVMFDDKVTATLSPMQLDFVSQGESKSFALDFELPVDAAPGWYFGQLVWTNATGQQVVQAIAIANQNQSSSQIQLDRTASSASSETYRLTTTNLTDSAPFEIKLDAIGGAEFDETSVSSAQAASIDADKRSIVVTSDLAPAAINMSKQALPFTTVDLSQSGASAFTCGNGCDEFNFELPFNFSYFGEAQSKITVFDNGLIAMGVDGAGITNTAQNQELPSDDAVNGVVAPFWTDFDLKEQGSPADTGGGQIFYEEIVDNGKTYLIVQWDKVQLWVDEDAGFGLNYWGVSSADVAFTFQVIIEKDTDNIWVNYLSVPEQPNFYTVGFESANGTEGSTFWKDSSGTERVESNTGALQTSVTEAQSIIVDFTLNKVAFNSEFAVNDNVTVSEDSSIDVDVLANDLTGDLAGLVSRVGVQGRMDNVFTDQSDFAIDATTLELVTEPTNGSVTVTSGVFTYEPNANFFGTDTFSYTVENDKGTSSSANVNVIIENVNDAPVINSVSIPSSVVEGDTITISATATDIDSDIVYYWDLPAGFSTTSNSGDFIVGQEIQVTYDGSSATSGVITINVTDGEVEVSQDTTITLTKEVTAVTPPPEKKSSGGGSTPTLLLMILSLLFIKRARFLSK